MKKTFNTEDAIWSQQQNEAVFRETVNNSGPATPIANHKLTCTPSRCHFELASYIGNVGGVGRFRIRFDPNGFVTTVRRGQSIAGLVWP